MCLEYNIYLGVTKLINQFYYTVETFLYPYVTM